MSMGATPTEKETFKHARTGQLVREEQSELKRAYKVALRALACRHADELQRLVRAERARLRSG